MFTLKLKQNKIIVLYVFFRRPVTKSLFRHYIVLGKGGFGEVNRIDDLY